jgi:hypothetical protein
MQRRIATIALAVVPALIAGLAVLYEPALTTWASQREALLPLSMILLFASLIQPRLRHFLVITLCYGVSFMALRDITRVSQITLPESLNYDFIYQGRPAVLLMVAGLAATAAIVETFWPNTVWARRCYFGAASLYFIGLGILHRGQYGSWQAVLLCATGVIAFFGCLFAHRIVASEIEEEEEEEVSDEAIQQLSEAAHLRALREKEWRDTLTPSEDEDRDTLAANSISSPPTAAT